MELYYTVTVCNRDKAAEVAQLCAEAGMRGTLTLLGHGTATSEQLDVYGLTKTEKAIVCGVADRAQSAQLFRLGRQKLLIDIPGNGIMMTIPLKSVAGGRTLAYLTDSPLTGGKPKMTFEHELIIVVMNEGYSDFVMSAARSAGAGGGTVLHAKGTAAGTAEGRAQRFFGMNLADEKDMVYIVAYSDEKAAIMRAITEAAGPGTEAGAICFSLPISAVSGLRQREKPESVDGEER